jgi:hypothetical protein
MPDEQQTGGRLAQKQRDEVCLEPVFMGDDEARERRGAHDRMQYRRTLFLEVGR